MEIVYRTIFSYSGGYNFLNQQVCFQFRSLLPKTHGCVYLDQLLKDGQKVDFTPSFGLVKLGAKFTLFSLLEACPELAPLYVCAEAIKNNNIKVLQWAYQKGYKPSEYSYFHIVQHVGMEMVKCFLTNGYSWSVHSYSYMAECGRLDLLEYLEKQGCPLTGDLCAGAAEGGHLEIIKWAMDRGCLLTGNACSGAAGSGHLEVLKWLREHECPWDEWTVLAAAEEGHLEVLKWAIANGCPWKFKKVYLEAGNNHRKNVTKWLRENYKEEYETCWDWS
ncbi:Ankyrin repeat-containing protein [Brazilian cedratvirus IHUMI]|uniref:Ankyrin repeat-containing protein n=1 Tax=Brazilian cedratvirus IHUMI TaxID=2126980 RepID=A0A2R8FFZ8_9VIRU|nr:Ankyrin repeat-containing protein [Brazilian cedratvirus IHUMI]